MLEPPSGFQHGTPGLGIHILNTRPLLHEKALGHSKHEALLNMANLLLLPSLIN